jgi:hypothetical protein
MKHKKNIARNTELWILITIKTVFITIKTFKANLISPIWTRIKALQQIIKLIYKNNLN